MPTTLNVTGVAPTPIIVNGVGSVQQITATGTVAQRGPQGVPGADSTVPGPKGDTGDTGPQGIQGIQGIQGLTGAKGDKGDTGDTGPIGLTGAKGDKGDTGEQGIQGLQGLQGETGPQGLQGEPGTTDYNELDNKPTFATVATSGLYSDLTGTPDLSIYDDLKPYADLAAFPVTGETDKLYLAEDTGALYRWNGSTYISVSSAGGSWGGITGDITNQLDLQAAFDDFALITDLAAKAPLASPALTGTPTTPTALNNSNNTTIANTEYVDTAVTLATEGKLDSIVAGTNITVDNTDPNNPVISASASSSVATLDDLTDVDVTTLAPSDGQVLTFDIGTSLWKPATVSTGGVDTDDQTAAEVPFTPAGLLAATNVQAALEELDTEKAATVHSHVIGDTTGLQAAIDAKQATLVSGTNIKTINGSSVLGSGDIVVESGSSGVPYTGATTDVDLGTNDLTANKFIATNTTATSGEGTMFKANDVDLAVPTGEIVALMSMDIHNQATTTADSQLYGVLVRTEGDGVDTGAAISIENNGRADGMYLGIRGKAGAQGNNAPSGIGLDLNHNGLGAENSSDFAGTGMHIWDWSTTNNGDNGPTLMKLNKELDPNNDHRMLYFRANQRHIEMYTPEGTGYDGTKSVFRLFSNVEKFNITANGNVTLHTGDIEIVDSTKGLIQRSPNGTRFRITVDDDGILTTTAI